MRYQLTPSNIIPFGKYSREYFKGEIKFLLAYITEEQNSYTTIVLTLYIGDKKFKNYRVVFMDTLGNLLEEQIKSDLKDIERDLVQNLGLNSNYLKSLQEDFIEKFNDYIVDRCYWRKVLLLDFDNPITWEESKNPDVKAVNDEYLKEVQKSRIQEEEFYLSHPYVERERYKII